MGGLAFAQRPIKNEENEGRGERGMRGEGGGEGFISRRDGSSYEIDFSNDVAHLSFLSFFFERVHAYFPAPGVFIFYVGQPRNIRENRVVVPSTDGPWP